METNKLKNLNITKEQLNKYIENFNKYLKPLGFLIFDIDLTTDLKYACKYNEM